MKQKYNNDWISIDYGNDYNHSYVSKYNHHPHYNNYLTNKDNCQMGVMDLFSLYDVNDYWSYYSNNEHDKTKFAMT